MELGDKVDEAKAFLTETLARYSCPVVNCSFGKDSMAMLHLVRSMGLGHLPVICYQDPWQSQKYAFARRIAQAWDLVVYDYPPIRTSMLYGKEIPAFVNEYLVSPHATLAVPKNIVEYQEGMDRYLCGVNFLTRPVGMMTYSWDVALVGHKDSDNDQIYGPVPLSVRVLYRDEGPDYVYPLKEWTDDDVWDYLECFQVPVQTDRYDVVKRCEWPDKTYNSDYWQACIRCIDKRRAGQSVMCPKFGHELVNQSHMVQEFTHQFNYFGEEYASNRQHHS